MILPVLCTVCLSDRWMCICPYFHAPFLRTPFLLTSHLDFTKTPEQLLAMDHLVT